MGEQVGATQPTLERLGVVGCGLMGSGVVEVAARAGLNVLVREIDARAAEAGRARIVGSLDRGVKRGKLSPEERDAALARVTFTTRTSSSRPRSSRRSTRSSRTQRRSSPPTRPPSRS
jgi:3-hydroxybutyryl-CoA dehydrogenase